MVSFVTVCKNNAVGLVRTLRSLVEQDYRAWTVHVQDGASSDGTLDIYRSMADSRFTMVSGVDGGVYDAMNRGLSQISGDLVWFLNAGDSLATKSVLGRVVQDSQEHSWKWAVGGMTWTDSRGSLRVRHAQSVSARRVLFGFDGYPHPACIFSRELIMQLGKYDTGLTFAADQEFCLRAQSIHTPQLLPFVVSDFAPGGISSRMTTRERHLEAHRLRASTGRLLLGRRSLDATVTGILVGIDSLRTKANGAD